MNRTLRLFAGFRVTLQQYDVLHTWSTRETQRDVAAIAISRDGCQLLVFSRYCSLRLQHNGCDASHTKGKPSCGAECAFGSDGSLRHAAKPVQGRDSWDTSHQPRTMVDMSAEKNMARTPNRRSARSTVSGKTVEVNRAIPQKAHFGAHRGTQRSIAFWSALWTGPLPWLWSKQWNARSSRKMPRWSRSTSMNQRWVFVFFVGKFFSSRKTFQSASLKKKLTSCHPWPWIKVSMNLMCGHLLELRSGMLIRWWWWCDEAADIE